MKYLSILQHTQSEWLGHIEDHLEGRGIRFGYARPFTPGGKLPDVATVGDGLVLVGGGPWGTASKEHLLPNLDREIRLVRACLMLDKPILALGLGAQILAIAAEGSSEPSPLVLDVGNAHRIKDGALNGFLPAVFPNVVYMRDRPLPPDYAEILAVDDAGHPAVFQIGPRAFGFTGHPGIRRAMIEDLIMETDDVPDATSEGLSKFLAVSKDIEDALVHIMSGIVQRTGWMNQS